MIWDGLPDKIICKSTQSFRKGLVACVKALEKHSKSAESADLRQGSLLPPYGIVPCIIAELSRKFHQNSLMKHTSTSDNTEKRFSRSKIFDHKSCSRVAWSRDPDCAFPLTCQ